MNIHLSEEVVAWYKRELDLEEGMYIRFFVRYGGFGGQLPSFSLGVNIEEPTEVYSSKELEGVTFYVEADDAWYFEEKDVHVHLDEKNDEPFFEYK
ncbi:MAG TPA: hypothetical protein VK075_00095 [Pseudogracilibacillus sp.]|nr:hypothetical protein [Pseudogracilibacillus sp.]